jgi:hypothetical protein
MAKRTPRTMGQVVSMPSVESPSHTQALAAKIAESEIARRAFQLYCERGGQHGHDLDDWLQAERELREGVSSAA